MTIEEPNLFEDPFSATWVKASSTVLYLFGLMTTVVVWSSWWEVSRKMKRPEERKSGGAPTYVCLRSSEFSFSVHVGLNFHFQSFENSDVGWKQTYINVNLILLASKFKVK